MDNEPNLLVVVVAAALTRPDGTVLLQQRPAGKAHAGLWEFPGGKVEAGETAEAALVRELAEELGIAVDAAAVHAVAFATGPGIVLLLYRAAVWDGEPRAIEAAALRWVMPAAMAALPMPPADGPLVEALMQRSGEGQPIGGGP